MLSAAEAKTGDEHLELFAELGYDYAELPLAQVMDLTGERFSGLLRRIRAEGIPVEACNNFFPAAVRLTGEQADLPGALEYARRALARASEMGAAVVVLGSSGAKNIPEGFPYERARAQFLEILDALDEIAASNGTVIALEPLNTQESNFVVNVPEGLALARETSRERIRLLADYYHMRMAREDFSVLRGTRGFLRHVHLAAKEGRVFPRPGDGEDYAAFFSSLRDIGYEGRISVEAYSSSVREDAVAARDYLRPLLA